jgi:Transposase DDE domain
LGTSSTWWQIPGISAQRTPRIVNWRGVIPLLACGREAHHPSPEARFADAGEAPAATASVVTRMRHRLKTVAGKAIYAKRKSTVEPVFGVIKQVMGFRQFLLRGLEAVTRLSK